LAVCGVLSRRNRRVSLISLTKVKIPALSPVAQVPSLHPYFAALLEQRQECETMSWHRFDVVLILEPHVVADFGLYWFRRGTTQ
jgi:hypothetical protein